MAKLTVILVLALFILLTVFGFWQSARSQSGKVIGRKSWEQWMDEAGWSSYAADTYNPSEESISRIARLAREDDISFLVFGGSWCPDTRAQLPEIMKVFKLAGIQPERFDLYGVDRQNMEPSGLSERYAIKRVPTVIVLSKGEEIGRITEFPRVSWEEDIVTLLSSR